MDADEAREELLELIDEDERVRERLARTGELFAGYHPQMEAVHRRNARRLLEIVDVLGWPGRTQVGDAAADAAWRIAQHAIGEPSLMRRFAAEVAAAVDRGDADPKHLAMLTDRIRVFEGRPQIYGTQYDWAPDGSAMVPMVGIVDPDRVDERRRRVGLPAFRPTFEPGPGETPPADMDRRNAEAEAWARRVGWRDGQPS